MLFALVFYILTIPVRSQSNQSNPLVVTTDRFEIYSNFWINLHHFLYQKSTEANKSHWTTVFEEPFISGLRKNETEIMERAIQHYQQNWIKKDLLFDDELYRIKRTLIKFNIHDFLSDEDLDLTFQQILNSIKPLYSRYFWSVHDKQNRLIVQEHLALIQRFENPGFDEIADLTEGTWPSGKIRVDLSYYSNWAGAYCTVNPIHVILISQPKGPENRWPQYGWFELLFHEPTHALILPNKGVVGETITKVSQEIDVKVQGGLWHAVLFAITGSVVQKQLKEIGIDHEPLMISNGIFSNYHASISKFMPPYVNGQAELEETLKKIIEYQTQSEEKKQKVP
jgi:hypothetical protein